MSDADIRWAVEKAVDDCGLLLGRQIRQAFVARCVELIEDVYRPRQIEQEPTVMTVGIGTDARQDLWRGDPDDADTEVGQSTMPPTPSNPDNLSGLPASPPPLLGDLTSPARQLVDRPPPISPQSHLLQIKGYAASGAPAEPPARIWDAVGQRFVPRPPAPQPTPKRKRKP
jgi:hypothetical protein